MTDATTAPRPAADVSARALDVAIGIARTLCATAWWDEAGEECTWIGRSPSDLSAAVAAPDATVAAGPLLYDGTAGIGLFLAEAARCAEDPEIARTAAGAVRRSARHEGVVSGDSLVSPFTGPLGAVLAARRLPGGDGVVSEARALLDRVASADRPERLDFLLGSAGAIPQLLLLAEDESRPDLREVAIRLGRHLCSRATWHAGSCFWDAREASGDAFQCPPPTGLSHGASGFSVALFDLYRSTGEEEFLTAARGALAYEDSLFSPENGNWVDTRSPHERVGASVRGAFMAAWCHGAPGIALARAHAAVCDPDRREQHEAAARLALATTAATAAQLGAVDRADSTLCHGCSGLSEVLAIGGLLLDDPQYALRAAEIAAALMDRHAATGDWPSGVRGGGPNPSLMVGLAGVGHHLLRLARPEVPPILLPARLRPATRRSGH